MATKLHEMTTEELLGTFVEVKIENSQDFLKVKETLTRMGIANKQRDTLFQSCHILHKKGKYYIVHFKQLLGLDRKVVEFLEQDHARLNTIAHHLASWGMLTIVNPDAIAEPFLRNRSSLTIIPHADKSKWKLEVKYHVGGEKVKKVKNEEDKIS